jgi:hypothetical protein
MSGIPSNAEDFDSIEVYVKTFLTDAWKTHVKTLNNSKRGNPEYKRDFLKTKRMEYLKASPPLQRKIYVTGMMERQKEGKQEEKQEEVLSKRRNRANNTAAIVPLATVLPQPQQNVNENYINQFRRFENIKVPLPKKPMYEKDHPGYKHVSTRGNGSCMYFAIYFSQHPELSTASSEQTDARALEIRGLIAAEANIDDVQAFDANSMEFSINREKNPKLKAQLITYRKQIEQIDAQLQQILVMGPEVEALLNQKLAIYKELLMLHTFWGENREIQIWNRIVDRYPERGFKKVYVWIAPYKNYEGYIPGGVPIHFDGGGHYSILSPIPRQDAIREAEDRRWATYLTQYEAARQREQDLRSRWRAKYGNDPRYGGKRSRTTRRRKIRKQRTRKQHY